GTVDVLSPAAGTWSSGPALPTPRAGLALAAAPDGTLFAVGGFVVGSARVTALATVEVLRPGSSSWASLPPLPSPRSGVAATVDGTVDPDVLRGTSGGGAIRPMTAVGLLRPDSASGAHAPPLPVG